MVEGSHHHDRVPAMPSIRSHLLKVLLKRRLRKGKALSLDDLRASMDRNGDRFKTAAGVTWEKVNVGERTAEWLTPSESIKDAAILYLHGGAYVVGSPSSHRALASNIARSTKARVLVLDYRLAPEHPYPAALDDAMCAFAWIQRTLKIAANRIVIMGDSAGGGLALATTVRLRDRGHKLPGALVALSPWTDLSVSGETTTSLCHKDPYFPTADRLKDAAAAYATTHPIDHPEISPLRADLHGFPPIYIQVGSDEVLLSDSVELAKAARAAGVFVKLEEWPGMWHVWHAFCHWMPESRDAIKRIGEFTEVTFGHS